MTLPVFALGCQGRAPALYPHLKTFFGWSKDLASWLFPPLPLLKCCWAPMAIEIKPFWLGRPQHYITTSVSPPFSSVVVGPLLQRSGFLGLANDQGTSAHTQNRAKWREWESRYGVELGALSSIMDYRAWTSSLHIPRMQHCWLFAGSANIFLFWNNYILGPLYCGFPHPGWVLPCCS